MCILAQLFVSFYWLLSIIALGVEVLFEVIDGFVWVVLVCVNFLTGHNFMPRPIKKSRLLGICVKLSVRLYITRSVPLVK